VGGRRSEKPPRRPEPKAPALDNDLAQAVETGLELVANDIEIVPAVAAIGPIADDVDALAPDLLGDKPIAEFRANNDIRLAHWSLSPETAYWHIGLAPN
jgi:hypothetical protein